MSVNTVRRELESLTGTVTFGRGEEAVCGRCGCRAGKTPFDAPELVLLSGASILDSSPACRDGVSRDGSVDEICTEAPLDALCGGSSSNLGRLPWDGTGIRHGRSRCDKGCS